MSNKTVESLQQGAIEIAESKLKQYWNVVKSASDSQVDQPSDQEFNRMAREMITSDNHAFTTPAEGPNQPGKTVTYDQVKQEARALLTQANLSSEQKQEYLGQLAGDIPTTKQFEKIASVTEETGEGYDNMWTKLKYGFKGFMQMVSEEGFFAAIGELFSSLFSGALFKGEGKIGEYGKQLAAADIKHDVKNKLHALAKTDEMKGILNTEMINTIGNETEQFILDPDAKKTQTTPDQRLADVEIDSFGAMAKSGIENTVDTSLDASILTEKRNQAVADINKQIKDSSLSEAMALRGKRTVMNSLTANHMETLSNTIKDPLKELLTSDKLELGDEDKLKAQVVGVVKKSLTKNEQTKGWKIVTGNWKVAGFTVHQNNEGLDTIANMVANEVVAKRDLLQKAHNQIYTGSVQQALAQASQERAVGQKAGVAGGTDEQEIPAGVMTGSTATEHVAAR